MWGNGIIDRVVLALALLLAGIALYWLFTRFMLLRARKGRSLAGADLPAYRAGLPAILYFTTPDCATCRTAQRPALQRVRAAFGECLQLIEVNAQERTDLADRWGVLSVPTTFILDASGQPREVNYGAASTEKLLRQMGQVLPGDAPLQMQSGDSCC